MDYYPASAQQKIIANKSTEIKNGDEQLETWLPLLKGKRVALLINQTATINNKLLLDILLKRGVNIVKVFVPEHGLRGQADAGANINNSIDSTTGIPIISLYGSNKKPKPEQIRDIDVLVYDLQDVGVRFFTYISTLQYAMEACAENRKDFIILDRPDPNGFYVDGPVLDTNYRSFVGMQPIPIVYGMTPGEYARMLVGEHWFHDADKLNLTVISCLKYDHNTKYNLRYAPSPNLKTMAAIYLYPSLCLFEGTVVSVGRGTDIPFQQYGHPDLLGKTNYSFTPESRPGASKPLYENQNCYGQLIAQTAPDALKAIDNQLQLSWLIQAYKWYQGKDSFFNAFFIKLAGNKELKSQIEKGYSESQIKLSWQQDIQTFKRIRKKYLLYTDFE